ncbi:helix-turn-helix domain-containing protein [Maribacter antarcticus]|uniref:helix-turn-helix domain-containing protein n=1 Tax=Maribacter antarcticus TaxID=505250 RepID=UPI00047CC24C|nr:helix-turn-helix domain-containing protein [Maribacter antarcticus]
MNLFKIKSFFALVFFSLFQVIVLSQESKNRKEALVDSVLKYYEIDSSKAHQFIKESILKSIKDNDSKSTFNGYHVLVMFYYKNHNEAKVGEYIDSLLSVAKNNNLKIELLMGYHLKNDDLRRTFGYDNERIFTNIFEAIALAKEMKNEIWECKFNQDISQYYMFSGQFYKSILHNKKNLSKLKTLYKSEDYKKFKVWGVNLESTYLSIAKSYIQLKKLDSAKLYNSFAKSILDTLDNSGYHESYKFKNSVNQLEIDLLENNPNSAKKKLNEALAMMPDYFRKSTKDFSKSYYSGMINYEQGNFKKAIGYFEAIDTVQIKSDESINFFYHDLHKTLYKTLYKSYLKTNNIKQADYYFEKHLSYIKGQIDTNNSANSNFSKIETDNYYKEVEKLKTQQSKQKYIIVLISLLSLFIIFITVVLYKKKQKEDKGKLEVLLAKISEKEQAIAKPKEVNLKIKDLEVERIITKLEQLENKKYFLRIDCTVSNLAKKIKTNTTYLSKIINSYYQKTFTVYINDLRIEFVIDRLKNDKLFRRYSIKSIANEIGFKSSESFNSAFKKRTGVLPSTLIRALENKN